MKATTMVITTTKIDQYITAQAPERQSILSAIHAIVIEEDSIVVPVVEPMMGKGIIVYKCQVEY